MANRQINSRFWTDNHVRGVDPTCRYLWLYFLTNAHTSLSGIYEIPIDIIETETGLTTVQVERGFEMLHPKVLYIDNWVAIINFVKYLSKSPKIVKGIEAEIKRVPDGVIDALPSYFDEFMPQERIERKRKITTSDMVSEVEIPHPKVNINNKDKDKDKVRAQERTEPQEEKSNDVTPRERTTLFFENKSNEQKEYADQIEKVTQADRKTINDEIKKFIAYWTEPTHDGMYKRWEKQDVFDVDHRLVSWFSRIAQGRKSRGRGFAKV